MRFLKSVARSSFARGYGVRLLVIALLLSVVARPPVARAEEPGKKPEKANRDLIYDEKADPKVQIAAAVKRATRENKRVLVTFGGNWCGWCYKLHDVFTKNGSIAPILRSEYELVMVDVRSNGELLESYGKDNRNHGVPFLTVLDGDGTVLTNQNTGDLEKGPDHDVEKVKSFLSKWTPKPVDAEEVLKTGLARAKTENKRVFLHLGAPWCGWCRVLDNFLEEKESVLGRDFVDLKIDVTRMTNGATVGDRLRKRKEGGIPWFAILDEQGMEMVNSTGPEGNIGYPARPHEIAHFTEMLKKTAKRMTPAELNQIQSDLESYAVKHNLR